MCLDYHNEVKITLIIIHMYYAFLLHASVICNPYCHNVHLPKLYQYKVKEVCNRAVTYQLALARNSGENS